MEISLLEVQEFEIECQVRGIVVGTVEERTAQLNSRISLELIQNEEVPLRAHEAALKNPRREIATCTKSLANLLALLKIYDPTEGTQVLHIAETRLMHYQNRLARISISPTARHTALCLGQTIDRILNALSYYTVGQTTLEEFQRSLKGIEIPGWCTDPLVHQESTSEIRPHNDLIEITDLGADIDDHDSDHFSIHSEAGARSLLAMGKSSTNAIEPPSAPVPPIPPADFSVPPPNIDRSSNIPNSLPQFQTQGLPMPQSNIFTKSKPTSTNNQQQTTLNYDYFEKLPDSFRKKSNRLTDKASSRLGALSKNLSSKPHSQPSNYNQGVVQQNDLVLKDQAEQVKSLQAQLDALTRQIAQMNCQNANAQRSPPSREAPNSTAPRHSYVPIHRWGFSFGDGSLGAKAFLYRVERTASRNGIPLARMVNDLGFLMVGEPKDWYWGLLERLERSGDVTWAQMRTEFLERYRDRRTDMELRHGLEARKQKETESFLEYYTSVSNMTLQFETTPTDVELLHILHRNMHIDLQYALAGETVTTVQQLIKRCVTLEDTWKRLKGLPGGGFHKPFRQMNKQINEVEDSQKYSPSLTSESQTDQEEVCALGYSKPVQNQSRDKSTSNGKCWNCSVPGHNYPDCPTQALHIFCYGCGEPNILKPNCSFCRLSSKLIPSNSSGNSRREMKNTGNLHLQTPKLIPKPAQTQTEEAAANVDPELRRQK